MMMIPCIIPARGGSKGIPHKNIVSVGGIPLLVWSLYQARECGAIDKVIVSTDDSEIGRVAADHGAEVFWRSQLNATDTASSESALLEVITAGKYGDCEAIVFLQATSPIRQPGDIDKCVEMVVQGRADSVFSARVVEGYTWKWSLDCCSPAYYARVPRQSRSVATIEENGSIYVFRPSVILQTGNRLGGRVQPYIMHPLDSFQIDEPGDIRLLEQLMELRLGCARTAAYR